MGKIIYKAAMQANTIVDVFTPSRIMISKISSPITLNNNVKSNKVKEKLVSLPLTWTWRVDLLNKLYLSTKK